MSFKASVTGLSQVQNGLLRKLNGVAKGELAKLLKVQVQINAEELKDAMREIAESAPSDWQALSEKAINLRAWRGIDSDTPWLESGWLLDCLIIDDDWKGVEIDADFMLTVRFDDNQTASHGADIDWVVWTLEFGGYAGDYYIPPRPLIQKVEEEIIKSGTFEKSYLKIFKDYFSRQEV